MNFSRLIMRKSLKKFFPPNHFPQIDFDACDILKINLKQCRELSGLINGFYRRLANSINLLVFKKKKKNFLGLYRQARQQQNYFFLIQLKCGFLFPVDRFSNAIQNFSFTRINLACFFFFFSNFFLLQFLFTLKLTKLKNSQF